MKLNFKALRADILFVLALSLVLASLSLSHPLKTFEKSFLDHLFRVRGTEKVHKDIVVIAIDDGSVETLAQWPWPRKFHAALLQVLQAAQPKVILFDVLFPENSDTVNDQIFAQKIKQAISNAIAQANILFKQMFRANRDHVACFKKYFTTSSVVLNSSDLLEITFTICIFSYPKLCNAKTASSSIDEESARIVREIGQKKAGEVAEEKEAEEVPEEEEAVGQGAGSGDKEFRNQVLTMKMTDISRFAPYDHVRITQQYKYEQGVLEETVELYKVKDGQELPFMKMEERASFYLKGQLDAPPTRWVAGVE